MDEADFSVGEFGDARLKRGVRICWSVLLSTRACACDVSGAALRASAGSADFWPIGK